MIFVPADLFELANIGDPWPQHLARFRRLMVSLWLAHGNTPGPATRDMAEIARSAWDCSVYALNRPGRVTVVTALIQLSALGHVRSFDEVEGGFSVELVKEAA